MNGVMWKKQFYTIFCMGCTLENVLSLIFYRNFCQKIVNFCQKIVNIVSWLL